MISACQGECLEEFAPLKATPDAQPWGDTGPLLIGVMALCSGPIGVIRCTNTRPTRHRAMPLHMTFRS